MGKVEYYNIFRRFNDLVKGLFDNKTPQKTCNFTTIINEGNIPAFCLDGFLNIVLTRILW